jgi:hypothetical protein
VFLTGRHPASFPAELMAIVPRIANHGGQHGEPNPNAWDLSAHPDYVALCGGHRVTWDNPAYCTDGAIVAGCVAKRNVIFDESITILPNDRSRRLVDHLHLLFIHPAPVHCDFRDGSLDLAKIRRRQLNIDCS